jgi:hypothetical protein
MQQKSQAENNVPYSAIISGKEMILKRYAKHFEELLNTKWP